jgi:hypothetical protein
MGWAGPTVSWSITCTKLHGERTLTLTSQALRWGRSLQYTLTPRADARSAPVGSFAPWCRRAGAREGRSERRPAVAAGHGRGPPRAAALQCTHRRHRASSGSLETSESPSALGRLRSSVAHASSAFLPAPVPCGMQKRAAQRTALAGMRWMDGPVPTCRTARPDPHRHGGGTGAALECEACHSRAFARPSIRYPAKPDGYVQV